MPQVFRAGDWPFRFLHCVSVLFLVATGLSSPGHAREGETTTTRPKPNIVVILADDLGWSDLGCYGADLHETPHLDRLATSGLRFTEAYAAAPVCTPTRAALMTGKHPARLHMTIWREATFERVDDQLLVPPAARADMPFGETTVAEALREAGYLTAHVGKWHLGDAGHFPEAHGFDLNIAGNHWGAPATHFFPYRVPENRERRYVPGLPWGRAGEYLADRLTDEAIKVMEQAGDRPFYLNLWNYGVHTPIEGKPADVEHFRGQLKPGEKHQNPTYAAMVKNLDDNVGRLVQFLEATGRAQNTLLVFSSDNGGYINVPRQQTLPVTNNAPLRSGKGSLYEGGIRVPLLVRWPGHTPNQAVTHEPVVTTDLYSTLLAAAGAKRALDDQQRMDGTDLTRLLADPQARLDRTHLYWHYPHYYPTSTPCSAVRNRDWKLIEFYETGKVELYRLADDLGETHDRAADQPEIASQLREQLHGWLKSVKAQLPVRNDKLPAG